LGKPFALLAALATQTEGLAELSDAQVSGVGQEMEGHEDADGSHLHGPDLSAAGRTPGPLRERD